MVHHSFLPLIYYWLITKCKKQNRNKIENNSSKHKKESEINSMSTCLKPPNTIPLEPTPSPPPGKIKSSTNTIWWSNTSNSPKEIPWTNNMNKAGI